MAETLELGPGMEPRSANSDPSATAAESQSCRRVEIDTSAPFESVREAATRFGGIGFWRPPHHRMPEVLQQDDLEEADIAKLEEQAAELEKDLILKERETLEVLKELEATKTTVEELKLKLQQKEASEVSTANELRELEKENYGHDHPGAILMELNQAKLNLSRTTNDLADIRASVELLNKKLEKERTSLEKTRERLTQNSLKVSSLEKELNDTKTKLKFIKEPEISEGCSDNPSEISKELQRLSCEAEKFKKMGENARSVVVRAMSEIEHTKNRIKTAEIRLVAARKMKEAARAAEAVALAEIKAATKSKNIDQNAKAVTISVEEYTSLTQKAKDVEENANKRVEDAMSRVDEANVSKTEILKKVDEAAQEIKTSKRALEEALERVEAANNAKLEVEEALRKWRSESGQRRRSSSVNNTAKFKNPCPPQYRRESRLLDVNGLNLTNDSSSSVPVLKPTMSIGQILSRKLLLADESEMDILGEKGTARQKVSVSLGQMLRKTNKSDLPAITKKGGKENGKQFTGKRKKFGFAKFSVLLNKESKKKKIALNLR